LTKTKPYCTVYGHPVIRYEQDGKKYTREGHPVVEVEKKDFKRPVITKDGSWKRA